MSGVPGHGHGKDPVEVVDVREAIRWSHPDLHALPASTIAAAAEALRSAGLLASPSTLERDFVTRQYHMHVVEALVAERDAARGGGPQPGGRE